jgi:hypothetical protein
MRRIPVVVGQRAINVLLSRFTRAITVWPLGPSCTRPRTSQASPRGRAASATEFATPQPVERVPSPRKSNSIHGLVKWAPEMGERFGWKSPGLVR